MRHAVTVMVMLLATTSMVPAAAAGPSGGAYAGTHVAFDVSGDAVTNYRVDGEPMLASVEMRSADDASAGVGVDADVSTMVGLDGAALSLGSTAETSATVSVEGGGSMTAHDNANGVLLVGASNGAQYVQAEPSDGATAEERSDGTVAVTTENGTTGTFLVVGEGTVSVNENGNVAAKVGQDGYLVFRSYPDGRDESDETQERLISNGTAVSEVYVDQRGGETVTDVVTYGRDTSVTAKRTAEHGVELTVDRAQHEGKVIIASLSDAAERTTEESSEGSDDTTEGSTGESRASNADDLRVTVDGEAAAKASSYGELRGAIGGDRSKYLVEQRSSANAEASADVLVAVNHFSTRTIRIGSADGTTGDARSDDATTDGGSSSDDGTTNGGSDDANDETTVDDGAISNDSGQPGFGVGAALAALLSVAFVAIRRR